MVKAIVGANWGDEGKGKITDMMAQEADIVADPLYFLLQQFFVKKLAHLEADLCIFIGIKGCNAQDRAAGRAAGNLKGSGSRHLSHGNLIVHPCGLRGGGGRAASL